MNTTRIGDTLEEQIIGLLQTEIEADRFFVRKDRCKTFRRKGYHSKDREGEIIFDVSIEVYLPDSTDYSILVLVECKNYTHPVPVNDAEEFFAKVQQVAAANAKAVIASTTSFQSGTLAFAKSKGIGLIRYFGASHFKWELRRSPSASARATDADSGLLVQEGLSREDFISMVFDLYMQSPARETNSLWDFIEDLAIDTSLTSVQLTRIANRRSRLVSQVPFLEKVQLETWSFETLSDINYLDGEVSLDAVCEREKERCGLKTLTGVALTKADLLHPILGRIIFEPLEIQVFAQSDRGRERFTLAHELAHHLLRHGHYMSREYCDEEDFFLHRQGIADGTDIARMEFQANYFAGSLLMPRTNFVEDFWRIVRSLGISDRGFGALYVDNQPCNLQSYRFVTNQLMQGYGVSRSAATIRLESLGLLRDVRTAAKTVKSLLASVDASELPDTGPTGE